MDLHRSLYLEPRDGTITARGGKWFAYSSHRTVISSPYEFIPGNTYYLSMNFLRLKARGEVLLSLDFPGNGEKHIELTVSLDIPDLISYIEETGRPAEVAVDIWDIDLGYCLGIGKIKVYHPVHTLE